MTIVKGDWRREKRYTQGHKSNGKHTLTKRKQLYSLAGVGSTVQPELGTFPKQQEFSASVSQTSLTKMPTYHDNGSEVYLSVNLPPHSLSCLHPKGKKLSFLVSLSEAKCQRPEATLSSQALSPSLEPSGVSWPACDLLNRKSLHHYSPKICF